MSRKDRRAAAAKAVKSGAALPPPSFAADPTFELGLLHHQSGRLQDAEKAYREVLARRPRHAGALSHLGILSHQLGHGDTAIELLRKAAAADKLNPQVHFNLGLVCAALGNDDDAIAANRRALTLQPDYAGAHTNLGALLMRRGATAEATECFAEALDLQPALPAAYDNYAIALLASGEGAHALDIVARGVAIATTPSLKATFLRALPFLSAVAPADRAPYRALLLRALNESWSRPADLVPAAVLSLNDDPATWPNDALLLALLRATPNIEIALERTLTALRGNLLADALSLAAAPDQEKLAFTCALAQQCFLNEYVFAVLTAEQDVIEALQARINTALTSGDEIPPFMLATLACYAPLHDLSGADALAARSWPAPVQPLIVQQIEEPRREQQLRASIEAMTRVDDPVSLKVQRQYEENAYPRWTRTAASAAPVALDAYIQDRFPGAPYRKLGDRPADLLIAGCGTGRQVIERLGQYKVARATAIDLSGSSLAYAMRKADEASLSNVRFAQADILQLGGDTGTFDVIESTGVLHHLREPFEGWRRLLSLLRPGGLMHVALYSAAARVHVRAARAFIAERGYEATPEGIRRFRQDAMALPASDPVRMITRVADFFTTSECRDYVFHVQESEFNLPQIADFLRDHGLQFVGFETMARSAYLRRFPDDPSATDLDNWRQFEIEHPATFESMYQFWIQKPA